MSQEIAVSVIVPVYNSEKYLIACAEGLLKQTLSNIELIFVDDCSTDNSLLILKAIEEKFPDKIMVVECEENHGAGGARNIGIQYARGEYLGFADSDDVVNPEMFEKMYKAAVKNNYDIVDCGFYDEKNDLAIVYTSDKLCGELNDEKRSELIVAGGYLWSRIYKRSFWIEQNLVMREHAILEDSEIVAKAFATAENITNVKEILYIYKNNPESLSKEINCEKYVSSLSDAMHSIYDSLSNLENYQNIRCAVEYEILQMYSYAMLMLLKTYKETKDTKDTKDTKRNEIFKMAENIRLFRLNNITKGYDNIYVRNKIDKVDIGIMERCDSNLRDLFVH